jgi:Mce-associated membrane protein
MSESSGARHSDPNADWARAIAEMTTIPEAAAGDVAQPDGAVSLIDEPTADENTAHGNTAQESTGQESIDRGVGADSSPTPHARPAGRSRVAIAAMLSGATILVGSLGIWATVAAHHARATAADANAALVDESATRRVEQAVSSAVNTVFSYNYADTARTKAAAQHLLTGLAIRQYNQLFGLVQQQAPKEKLVVTTRVTDIGVELLTGARARLLIFANEQDSKAGASRAIYGGAMFAVTAVNQRGRWLIENIDTFTGPA